MDENRFSPRAQRALELAERSAGDLGHSYIGTEHLLLGLLREEEGIARRVLEEQGLTESMVQKILINSVGRGIPGTKPTQGLTPRAKRAIESAVEESMRGGFSYVGTEHLLVGLLRDGRSMGVRILRAAGLSPQAVFESVRHKLQEAPTGQQTVRAGEAKEESGDNVLQEFTRDLTAAARSGKLDPVIGRDEEIQRVIQILSRRTKNNPVLIGEPGVGKTAVAEGLAQRIAAADVPEELLDKQVLSLDLSGMVAGTKYRGEFEERIKKALDEVKKNGRIILFIDELHTIVGAGSAEGAMDAANIIKPALGRGEIRVIGATTLNEYRKYIEKDAALERRFQPVTVGEPSPEACLDILKGLRDKYEAHHRLSITDGALQAAVDLSRRYINDRFLPDKAIDLMDEAASRVRMKNEKSSPDLKALEEKLSALRREKEEAVAAQDFEKAAQIRDIEQDYEKQMEIERDNWHKKVAAEHGEVTEEDIAAVVSEWTGVPVTRLTEDEGQKLLHMEETLHKRVVGQDEAVKAIARAIRRGRVGLKDPKRPIGSFLFLGPTGVGKTELCKALAEAMFGDENAMVRLDMSEYMERHTVSRLIGSPPGYVGHEEGGQLTEKVRRRPYSVVLFDEIEKAHEDVWNLLLQIMDDGELTDSQGRRVDFRNTVIVMTSNVGAKNITAQGKRLGFADTDAENTQDGEKSFEAVKDAVMAELKRTFRPEFMNRIDETIIFHPLNAQDIAEIARKLLAVTARRVEGLGISMEVDDAAVELVAKEGFDPVYGARPLRRAIQSNVEDAVAEALLQGEVKEGDHICATAQDGRIAIIRKAEVAAESSDAPTENSNA